MDKTDKRVARSIRLIKNSFFQLLKEKDIEKISVVEICELAGISRYTFYTHYEDINALRRELEEEAAHLVIDNFESYRFDKNAMHIIDGLLHALKENPDHFALWLSNPLSDSGSISIIYDYVYQQVIPVWKQHSNLGEAEIRLLIRYVMYGTFAILQSWQFDNFAMEETIIRELMENVIKNGVYHYIYIK